MAVTRSLLVCPACGGELESCGQIGPPNIGRAGDELEVAEGGVVKFAECLRCKKRFRRHETGQVWELAPAGAPSSVWTVLTAGDGSDSGYRVATVTRQA